MKIRMSLAVLIAFCLSLASCFGGSLAKELRRYEPPMDQVQKHLATLNGLIQAGDINHDGLFNWFEMLIVLDAWATTIQADVEASQGNTDTDPEGTAEGGSIGSTNEVGALPVP